jgi:hypothetical protein
MALEQDSSFELRTIRCGSRGGRRPGHRPDQNGEQRHASDERSG